jgi:NAD(P)-dependent dehydrogenase (short-subunit alcohol dehydrogenase family)
MPRSAHLLIVGARQNSLGSAIFNASKDWIGFESVHTAGLHNEHLKLDITNSAQIRDVLNTTRPDLVVCTVGANDALSIEDAYLPSKLTDAMRTNVIGPLDLLRHFVHAPTTGIESPLPRKFVVISSNSARIARTKSISYCASKAALSMGIRCAARELARDGASVLAWGYEPGLLDTVMTEHVAGSMNWTGGLHRMEGVAEKGLEPLWLADRILSDLLLPGNALNGCMIPFDSGEQ